MARRWHATCRDDASLDGSGKQLFPFSFSVEERLRVANEEDEHGEDLQ